MIHNRETGFTLIELLAVMIVGGILLAAMTSFYLQQQRAMKQQQIQIETSQSLRVALEQMVRDIRSAGRNPRGDAGVGFKTASSHELRFTLDTGFDGVDENEPEEHKGFRQEGTEMQSYVPGTGFSPWQPLAGFLLPVDPDRPIFTYYDEDGNELSPMDLEAIARIDIRLTVTNRVPGAPPIVRTETASVKLRNR